MIRYVPYASLFDRFTPENPPIGVKRAMGLTSTRSGRDFLVGTLVWRRKGKANHLASPQGYTTVSGRKHDFILPDAVGSHLLFDTTLIRLLSL